MKPYNKKTRCVKCGECDINSIYHAEKKIGCPAEVPYENQEHICRCCSNCEYEWAELVLNGNFNKEYSPEDFTEGKLVNVWQLGLSGLPLTKPTKARVIVNPTGYTYPPEVIHLNLFLDEKVNTHYHATAHYKQCEIIE